MSSFIINASSNTGGSIIPNGEVEVQSGESQTFEFSAEMGYKIDKVIIDNVEYKDIESYTFENVQETHSIELSVVAVQYIITSSTSDGGTIYPLGDINVQEGNTQTFEIFPNDNYKVSKILVDGVEVENKSAYTFNNVNGTHTISVEFVYVPKIFTISVIYGLGGKINPEKTFKVTEGTDETVTVIPDNKYEIEQFLVDDEVATLTNNTYTFTNISDNHSISAKFKYVPSYYTITSSCNEGGSIDRIGEHSFIEYSNIEYKFTPNKKYRVKNVIVDDVSYGSMESYTFSDLSDNHTLSVEFEYVPDKFNIEVTCGDNGIVSQNGTITVIENTDFTLNIQPNNGYKINQIHVDGTLVDNSNSITIKNIWENHTISVTFVEKKVYTITSTCDDGCKIYPLGSVNVYESDNQKFDIVANEGYYLKDIKVDNVSIDFDLLNSSYTFENLSSNHTISVISEKIETNYYVSAIASNYGSISPSGVTQYNFGEDCTYHFSPMSGYKLNNLVVDGKVIKISGDSYTFYKIRGNHTITANFKPIEKIPIDYNVNGLGVNITYDIYNRTEPSKIYLSEPHKHLLGVLNGVDESSCSLTVRANNTWNISFNVNRFIDGEVSNYYDRIDVMMELYVSSVGWFKITQSPTISYDGNNETISINAESYEIELQQYDKVGFVVNKASVDSLEMMATDNVYEDTNGYKLFRDNVHFYRDTTSYDNLYNDFTSLSEDEQTVENLKLLSKDNYDFLISSWRFTVNVDTLMLNLPTIKTSLTNKGYTIDYLEDFQQLYSVKDGLTGESSLTSNVVKTYCKSHPELIEYLPLDINYENITVRNKVFTTTATSQNGEFSATLNVEPTYSVVDNDINFIVDVVGNKGKLSYNYNFSGNETKFIKQNNINWKCHDLGNVNVTVTVKDTYLNDSNVEETQTLTLTTTLHIFEDKDKLSDYLITNNITTTYEEYEYYTLAELINLERTRMKELSLLDQILIDCPSWKVGYIDDYVDEDYPTLLSDDVGAFEIDSQDVYSLLTQTIAQYFSCIFIFNTMDMTVNAYRVSGLGRDTNINLGYRNVQNSIDITPTDELYTVFNVSNGDNLNLAYVNFGDREIEDISYFLNTDYLDQTLIDKYNAWQEYRESFRDEYIEYSRLYNNQTNTVSELYNRLPVDGLDIKQYESFSPEELSEELNNYIALIEGIKSCFKLYENGSEYEQITIRTDVEHGSLEYSYYGLKENLDEIKKSMYWNDYKQYKIIVENILVAMHNFGLSTDDDEYIDAIDDWKWDMISYGYMYGLDELNAKLSEYKDGIEVYSEYAGSYENSDKRISEISYNEKHKTYLKYKEAYDKCRIVIKEREVEVSIAESILNDYYNKRYEIMQKVKKINWSNDDYPEGFTDEDLEKLGRLYKSTDYVNENIIYTSLSSNDDIIDKALELYDDAIENLYANSHPRLAYSTSQDNLLAMVDYSDFVSDFKLFNFIRVSIRDDYQVQLRVIEYSFNPMVYENDLTLTFSNMIQYKSKRNDFAVLLDNAISSAKNQITSLSKVTSKDNEFSFDYDLVKSLLSSKAFGSYMGSYVSNNISTEALLSDGVLEAALSKLDNISSNSAFIQYLNSNLLVTNDAYMDYLNSNLVVANVADIRTLMFGSATGDTLQSKFSNSVISLLGDATIKSAMIESLNASKINAGELNTNNVKITSDSGNLLISDNTIQIKDDSNVTRVQIGKDATNDYNMYVLDENGNVMFDATGLHENGIKEGIIRDDMVSDNANISGSKLNIQSLYSSMNDSGYTLNASHIFLDADKQNLEVAFNSLNSKVIQQGNRVTSYGTKINMVQGQINSKVWQSDIDALSTEGGAIYNLSNSYTEFKQEYDGFTQTVSKTYATLEDLGNMDLGVRNIILNSDTLNESSVATDTFTYTTSIPITPNTQYTFVINGFANNSNTANGGFGIYFGNNLVEDKILCRTESDVVILTVTSPSVITDEYHVIFKNEPTTTAISSTIKWVCMYEGDVAASTSWIPAPEDNKQLSSQAYTLAKQTATDFSWLVVKDEQTSSMTLSDEALQIIANNIEVSGTVSFGSFDDSTKATLSSQLETNDNMILKLYNGTTTPVYTPINLVLSAYSGYADDRKTYSGKFKIEQLVGDTWSVAQDITTTASTTLSVKLSDILDNSATKVRCYLYSNDETPMLIDFVTLDIVDDFSSMLSVQNNKTYVDGGNVYCATLDADAIFSNDISFTGTITGGNVDGGGIIKSYNYVVNTSGTKINLYDGTIDTKNFKLDSNGNVNITGGSLSLGNGTGTNVVITSDGKLSCVNADVSGKITSTDGKIGGWDINSDSIYSTKSGLSSSTSKYAFWAGETNSSNGSSGSNAVCYITHDGYLYAKNVNIEGDITANSLTLGEGALSYNDLSDKPYIPPAVDTTSFIKVGDSIKLGSTPSDGIATPSSGVTGFTVSSQGLLKASNAVIYGSLYATFANIYDSIYMYCDGYSQSDLWRVMTLTHYGMADNAELIIGNQTEETMGFQRVTFIPDILFRGNLTYTDDVTDPDPNAGNITCRSININGESYLNRKLNMGTSGNYYISDVGNGFFKNLWIEDTPLSSLFAPYSHSHSGYASSSHTHTRITSGSYDWLCNSSGNLIPRYNQSDKSGRNIANANSRLATIYATKMNTGSDIRTKNDLGDLEYSESIKLLNGLKPKKYTYKYNNDKDIHHGLYAQDLRDLLIDSGIGYYSALGIDIITDKDDTQKSYDLFEPEENVSYGIDYNQFTADLINGWKYHEEEINELKGIINKQQSEIDELKQTISSILEKL